MGTRLGAAWFLAAMIPALAGCVTGPASRLVDAARRAPEAVMTPVTTPVTAPEASPESTPEPSVEATLPPSRDPAAVERVFTDFQAALAAGDVDAARALLSERTLDRLDDIADPAAAGAAEDFAAEPLTDRFYAVVLRVVTDHEQLVAWTGEEVFAELVTLGLITAEEKDAELGAVEIVVRAAYIEVLFDGQPTGLFHRFLWTDDGWHYDLERRLTDLGYVLEAIAEEEGLADDELVLTMVSDLTGMIVDESVYDDAGWAPTSTT